MKLQASAYSEANLLVCNVFMISSDFSEKLMMHSVIISLLDLFSSFSLDFLADPQAEASAAFWISLSVAMS